MLALGFALQLSFSVATATAAVVATVVIDSPTGISVELSGELEGEAPDRSFGEISIVLPTDTFPAIYQNDLTDIGFPSSIIGEISPFEVMHGVLYGGERSRFGTDTIAPGAADLLTTGQSFSGVAHFIYPRPHQIAVGESFDVFWGAEEAGIYQSSGLTVPEPGVLSLQALALVGLILKRRR